MPELPEVETVRRGLLTGLPGQAIVSVHVHRAESVALPTPRAFVSALRGQTFVDVRRRGKYLVFDFASGATMVVHLRMSGRLLIMPTPAAVKRAGKFVLASPHERVRFVLDHNLLVFDDTRVFGRVWYLPPGLNINEISGIATLGPEPLEGLSPTYLQARFAQKKQPLKLTLLDQTIIAGIGNIYADEVLHLAGLNPNRPACSLAHSEIERLIFQIEQVLAQAIALGGSSIRDYTNAEGVNGNYQAEAFVYGRKGKVCKHCQCLIERIKLGGRSTHFCPACQPTL